VFRKSCAQERMRLEQSLPARVADGRPMTVMKSSSSTYTEPPL
jgi:hypothetical protein